MKSLSTSWYQHNLQVVPTIGYFPHDLQEVVRDSQGSQRLLGVFMLPHDFQEVVPDEESLNFLVPAQPPGGPDYWILSPRPPGGSTRLTGVSKAPGGLYDAPRPSGGRANYKSLLTSWYSSQASTTCPNY